MTDVGCSATATRRGGPPGICALIVALKGEPKRYTGLIAATGLSVKTVHDWIGELRACGLVRIGGWEKDSRGYMQVPQFQWVEIGMDATDVPVPRVSPVTSAERSKQWRARKRREREAANDPVRTQFANGVSPWTTN